MVQLLNRYAIRGTNYGAGIAIERYESSQKKSCLRIFSCLLKRLVAIRSEVYLLVEFSCGLVWRNTNFVAFTYMHNELDY